MGYDKIQVIDLVSSDFKAKMKELLQLNTQFKYEIKELIIAELTLLQKFQFLFKCCSHLNCLYIRLDNVTFVYRKVELVIN